MDAQQELFTKIKTRLEAQGFDVYDGALPPEDVPYPFVYIADNQQVDRTAKGGVVGTVSQSIDVYHNDLNKRGTFSNICTVVKAICRSIDHTENYTWICKGIDHQTLPDNTTKEPLLHGRITADYEF